MKKILKIVMAAAVIAVLPACQTSLTGFSGQTESALNGEDDRDNLTDVKALEDAVADERTAMQEQSADGIENELTIAGVDIPESEDTKQSDITEISGLAEASSAVTQADDKKVLVAYFSMDGSTSQVASEILKLSGGTAYEIQTAALYPEDAGVLLETAQDELALNARPALVGNVDDMAQYDTIILGYPIWFGTAPMAVLTFLESYDLTGKTILPYCVSTNSTIDKSVEDIKGSAVNAQASEGLRISSMDIPVMQDELIPWLLENEIMTSIS